MRDLRRFAAILLPLALTTQAPAQSPLMLEPELRLNISPADIRQMRQITLPELPRDIDLSEAARRNFRPVIEMSRDRSVRLPLALNFRVSDDRETLVQLGDPLFRMHPQRLDLFWIGDAGEISREITNQFDGNARAAMSPDGYLAVAGGAFLSETPQNRPKPKRVQLYDPRGNVLAETGVAAELEVTQLIPMREGQGVVYATAPGDAPLEKNQLFLLQKEETRELDAGPFGVVQKVVVLDEALAFVQGTDGFGLIDLLAGETRWVQPERIRLVGPNAAALGEDGTLLIMTGERVSSAAVYRWTLSVLEVESGKTMGQRALDGQAPGTFAQVFEDVRDGSALIRFGDEARRVSIQ